MIDFEFIAKLEGFELDGYVPAPDGGTIESGVTIASGFDLGQRSEASLPEWMQELFGIYCGVTGHAAERMLNELPLHISLAQAVKVNEYAHKQALSKLLTSWPVNAIPFACLADECQTVIASVAFQYGFLPRRTPNFWRQVTNGEWFGALSNLRNFGDAFNTRRNKEADYLEARLNEMR